ncbi:hypothetical protein [Aquisphaera giovannonii]|uniref:hypothetical protein n=1 Tax=Aquisphaera giovannonii TaxID=406548 RepID=UPI00143CE573|nr:hypothetical protein [Aquisphaera giovannonii]
MKRAKVDDKSGGADKVRKAEKGCQQRKDRERVDRERVDRERVSDRERVDRERVSGERVSGTDILDRERVSGTDILTGRVDAGSLGVWDDRIAPPRAASSITP